MVFTFIHTFYSCSMIKHSKCSQNIYCIGSFIVKDKTFGYVDTMCPIGIGKTTLAHEICLKWTKESFLAKEYDLVILIQLRTVQERTLQQEIIDAVGSEAAYDELLTKCHGNRCLIILEGLDEISAHWQKNDEMFSKLVNSTTFLSCTNIIITSRPHACVHLCKDKKFTRTIEIVGFGKTRIKEYAEMYFNSKHDLNTVEKSSLNTAEKFMEQVYSDPHISSLCYVPLCLNMVLECYKHNDKALHKTFTGLYQSFVVSRVNYHIEHKKAMPLGTVQESDKECFKNLDIVLSDHDVPELLEGALETLFLLSKLAYKSYFEHLNSNERNPKIVYVKKHLTHCNITNLKNDACGLLKATNTLFATGNTAVYSFNHLSVQEYFCALYISLLPEDQQLQLLKDHITDYPHMWPFYAGITKLRSFDVLHYLQQYMLQDKHLENIVQLESPMFLDCRNVSKNCNISDQQTMIVLNSIHEAQLSKDVCKYKAHALFMFNYRFRQYDYMCISYFMSEVSITQLYLPYCNIRDQEVKILTQCKEIPSLKVLDLSCNHITCKGIECLTPIITNLTHLSVAHNPNIGDDGIKLFSTSLLKFSSLIQLDIRYIGMTIDGAYYGLSEYLKCNDLLQSLEVSYNNITEVGLTFILLVKMVYQFSNFTTSLTRLSIKRCNLGFQAVVSVLTMALSMYKTLKYLDISENHIEDHGMRLLSLFLKTNETLVQLSAHSCGFHGFGSECVADMLLENKTLKYLNISNNDIGDDGITAITCSIEVNTTLIQLKIYDGGYGCKGLEAVNKVLKVNKTLKELCISVRVEEQRHIEKVGCTVLETFLKSDCKLPRLNVCSHCEGIKEFINKAEVEISRTTGTDATRWTVDEDTIRPYGNHGQILRYVLKVASYDTLSIYVALLNYVAEIWPSLYRSHD